MTKIKIEELGCFNEVASVIGVAEAKRELFIATSALRSGRINLNSSLFFSFNWDETPQHYWFWHGIWYKANNG